MMIDHFKLIFWDFDGVIKESLQVKTDAFIRLFEDCGQHVVDKIVAHHLANGGLSRFEKFPLYLKWAGRPQDDRTICALGEEFSDLVSQAVVDAPWVPGAERFIKANPYDQTFVVVSATPQEELECILQNLSMGECFASVFGSPTPKRDALQRSLACFNCVPRNSLMIGDAISDFNAATANGIPFLLRVHSTNREYFNNYSGRSVKDMTNL